MAKPRRRSRSASGAPSSSVEASGSALWQAADAEAAMRVVIEEYGITDPERERRLVAQPIE